MVLPSAFWSGRGERPGSICPPCGGVVSYLLNIQGASFQTVGDPVLFLSNPKGIDGKVRRSMLDSLATLNRKHLAEIGDPGDTDNHRTAGDGFSHAVVRSRVDRYFQGTEGGFGHVRPRGDINSGLTQEIAFSLDGWPRGTFVSCNCFIVVGIIIPACPRI